MKKSNLINDDNNTSNKNGILKKFFLILFVLIFLFVLFKTAYVFSISFIKSEKLEYKNDIFGVDVLYLA